MSSQPLRGAVNIGGFDQFVSTTMGSISVRWIFFWNRDEAILQKVLMVFCGVWGVSNVKKNILRLHRDTENGRKRDSAHDRLPPEVTLDYIFGQNIPIRILVGPHLMGFLGIVQPNFCSV